MNAKQWRENQYELQAASNKELKGNCSNWLVVIDKELRIVGYPTK